MFGLERLRPTFSTSLLAAGLLILPVSIAVSGCKSTPATPDDATLNSSLNRELGSDTAIANQPIQGSVSHGVATLSGSVNSDAQRVIAARDAAGIQGITAVQNNLMISPASVSTASALPPAIPVNGPRTTALVPTGRPDSREERERIREEERRAAADRQARNNPAPVNRNSPGQPIQGQPAPIERTSQPAPYQPPPPSYRTVTVPAGTMLAVRMTQTLDSATTQAGASFSGSLASDVLADGLVAVPAGSGVNGRVDNVQEASHFSGASLLTISLTGLRARGERLGIGSEPYTVEGKSRGKNTAEKAGIGAVGGAILGGILGGGKGAAIGAGVGGAGGAGVNAVTRGQQVQIPSESIVRFRISGPLTLRVRTDNGGFPPPRGNRQDQSQDPNYPRQDPNYPRQNDNGDPTLQRRPQF